MFRSKKTKRQRLETSNPQSCSSQHVSSHDKSSQQLSRQRIQQSSFLVPTFMKDNSVHPNSNMETSLFHNEIDNQSSLSFTQLLQSSLHTSLCTPHVASLPSSLEPLSNVPNNGYSSQSPSATSQCDHQLQSVSPSDLETSNDQDGINESKLMEEVQIVDNDGVVLRMQKISLKDVYKVLKPGEKVLVHVNELGQPIKAAGGLCTRFMRLLLEQPNICPPDAKTFSEVKEFSGLRLLDELRDKFCFPLTPDVIKVMFANFDNKFRSLKHRLKSSLLEKARTEIKKVRKANMVYFENEEKFYTNDQLLEGLDYVQPPPRFTDHQWQKFKSYLQSEEAKELSRKGKVARDAQIHTHTTGGKSFARKRDEFMIEHKRDPYEVEFFDITYKTKSGSYVQFDSQNLMELAKQSVAEKIATTTGPIDSKMQAEIEHTVMKDLMGEDMPGRARGYGIGVTKSQVTPLNNNIRKMRSTKCSMNQNLILQAQVDKQNKLISCMSQRMNDMEGLLKMFMSGKMPMQQNMEAQSRRIYCHNTSSQEDIEPSSDNDRIVSSYRPSLTFDQEHVNED